ncbi:MAG: MBL fold metallo-hydrolase [Alteromonadaceae bacterium]|nr:MBL fold metallo-hydrolase [Alteromonadaceae bacterium]
MNIRVIPVTPFAQNCSLIWDPDTMKGALVDPGGDSSKLYDAVTQNGVTIEKVILTHGHLDHVGATTEVASHYNVPVIGPHTGDKFWLDGLPMQSQMFGFPPATPFAPDQWLNDNDTITVGNLTLEVLHCPGHTPGHVALVERTTNTVIVGDILFAGSIGRTDFPQGNHQQLIDSIRSKLFTLPDEMKVYPGHGPTSTIGHERKTNPFVADSKFG